MMQDALRLAGIGGVSDHALCDTPDALAIVKASGTFVPTFGAGASSSSSVAPTQHVGSSARLNVAIAATTFNSSMMDKILT